jgi:hypothetical protein
VGRSGAGWEGGLRRRRCRGGGFGRRPGRRGPHSRPHTCSSRRPRWEIHRCPSHRYWRACRWC